MGQAKAAAQKALAIDETVAEAHASLGIVSLLFEWDWPVAEKEFRRALELNPGNAYDHHWYAHYLDSRGRFDEGLAEMSKAIELDPLSEMFNFDHGFQLALQHRPDEALAQFRRVQQINPANPFAQFGIAFALERAGKREEALAALQKTEIAPSAVLWSAVGSIYARLGKMEEARKLLAKMMEQAKKSYVPAMETGMLCFAVGEKGQGFSYLERAYEERSSGFTYLLPDPSFDSVRADPRFAAVVKKVGMPPPVWQAR
jgi:pentatricopeptide repeat protein